MIDSRKISFGAALKVEDTLACNVSVEVSDCYLSNSYHYQCPSQFYSSLSRYSYKVDLSLFGTQSYCVASFMNAAIIFVCSTSR